MGRDENFNDQIDPNRIQLPAPTSPFQSNCDWKLKPRDWKINQNTWMSARWGILSLSIPFLSLLPSGFQVFAMLTLAPCEGIDRVQSLTQAGVASAIPHESSWGWCQWRNPSLVIVNSLKWKATQTYFRPIWWNYYQLEYQFTSCLYRFRWLMMAGCTASHCHHGPTSCWQIEQSSRMGRDDNS